MAPVTSYPVPALEKGLDILEALAAAAVPQSLAELAVRLDRSSGELFRMLNCLERRRYLTRDALSGKYELSLKLLALAHAHSIGDKLVRFARRPMQELTETLRQSCHLSVLDRDRLLVVAQEESPEPIRLSIEVGGRFDPVTTTSGRLLMAQLAGDACEAILDATEAGQRQTAAERFAFLAGLEKVRARGWSRAESESIEGVYDLAVPVGSPQDGIMAALAVTCLRGRVAAETERVLVDALQACAHQIMAGTGFNS